VKYLREQDKRNSIRRIYPQQCNRLEKNFLKIEAKVPAQAAADSYADLTIQMGNLQIEEQLCTIAQQGKRNVKIMLIIINQTVYP